MSAVLLGVLCALTPAASSTPTLSLAEAVSRALGHNGGVRVRRADRAMAELAERRAMLAQVRARVDASLEELWARAGMLGDRPASTTLGLSDLSARVEVPLFAGFRLSAGIAQAEARSRAAEADVAAAEREVAREVALAFAAVHALEQRLEVEQAAQARVTEAERAAAVRVSTGLAPRVDSERLAARRLAGEVTSIELAGERAVALAGLAAALDWQGPLSLEPPPRPAPLSLGVDELLVRARSRRSELRAAEHRVEAEAEGVTIARAGWLPELTAVGSIQLGNNPAVAGVGARGVSGAASPFAELTLDVQAGVRLSINLFDTFATTDAVTSAQQLEQRRRAEQHQLVQQVEREVHTAYARVQQAQRVARAIEPAQAGAEAARALIARRYEAGEASVLELLDAELELLELHRRRARTIATLQQAWLELEAAVGRIIGVES